MIIESHPEQYNGYPFITLIQFNERHVLTIVDNYNRKTIKAYVLDFCENEEVDEIEMINIANDWYKEGNPTYPISIEFAKQGLLTEVSKVYRTYAIESISRLIGPAFSFEMDLVQKIRRKRRIIPNTVIPIQQARGSL